MGHAHADDVRRKARFVNAGAKERKACNGARWPLVLRMAPPPRRWREANDAQPRKLLPAIEAGFISMEKPARCGGM